MVSKGEFARQRGGGVHVLINSYDHFKNIIEILISSIYILLPYIDKKILPIVDNRIWICSVKILHNESLWYCGHHMHNLSCSGKYYFRFKILLTSLSALSVSKINFVFNLISYWIIPLDFYTTLLTIWYRCIFYISDQKSLFLSGSFTRLSHFDWYFFLEFPHQSSFDVILGSSCLPPPTCGPWLELDCPYLCPSSEPHGKIV